MADHQIYQGFGSGSAFLESLDPDPHFLESLDLDPDTHFDPETKIFFCFFETQIFSKNEDLDPVLHIFHTLHPDPHHPIFQTLDPHPDPDPHEMHADPKPCLKGDVNMSQN